MLPTSDNPQVADGEQMRDRLSHMWHRWDIKCGYVRKSPRLSKRKRSHLISYVLLCILDVCVLKPEG